MGSDFSEAQAWTIALTFGGLYLIFDAARFFIYQISPVRLRSLSGADPQFEKGSRWFQYNTNHFIIISGAFLQVCMVISVLASLYAMSIMGLFQAVLWTAGAWIVLILMWKMMLTLVSEELAELGLRTIIPVSYIFYYLFFPVLFPLRWLLERIHAREEAEADQDEATDEEVQAYIDVGEEEGIIEKGEGKLIQSIVDFGDRVAKELMTPRIDILALDVNSSMEVLALVFSESKYARIPLFEQNIDKIVGVVHIKDCFDAFLRKETGPIRDLARPAYFVQETKSVSDLLRELQSEHLQIAIVVDEYDGTAGLITIEDIVEEIVGDISAEHEDEEESVVEVEPGVYLVNGLVRVETLEEYFEGVEIRGDDYETVAGLIFTALGRVPKVGQVITRNDMRFEVDRADRKRIYRVRVMRESKGVENDAAAQ